MEVFVETERLLLREMLPTDVDGMFELDSNPLVHKYLGKRPVKTKEQSAKMISNVRQQYLDKGIGRWVAIEKASGDFIGWSGLKLNFEKEWNRQINFYDVGYRFIPRYWGKGYATESALAALEYGFKVMHLETIVGMAEKEHKASNKVLKKIGLQYVNDFFIEEDNVIACWYELNKEEYGKKMP